MNLTAANSLLSPHIVPDLLAPNLRLVFCGTAPSAISAREKAYYANPANWFWPTLHRVGITPSRLHPSQYHALLTLGIGLTDLCKTCFGNDDQLPKASLNREALTHNILQYQPGLVAFTSKNAASIFLDRKVEYGLQPECVGRTQLYALCSTSGRARRFWREEVWQELAVLYHELSSSQMRPDTV